MNIHPLWFICVLVRISLIFLLRFLFKSQIIEKRPLIKYLTITVLFVMGAGFIYNGIFGSNNEIQVAKVFWHETRFVHGALYLLATYYLYKNNIEMNTLVLANDLLFSFMYRFYMNK